MCEALICFKNLNANMVAYPQTGDVIDLRADGWPWAAGELGLVDHPVYPKHSFFRVVKFPNITVTQASKMMTPEQDVDSSKPSPYLQFRAFYLDITKIPVSAIKTYLNDDTRAQGFITVQHTASQLNAIVTQRTAIPF